MVVIDKPCFSIPQICESGQCFRLDPVAADIYVLQAADRYLKIRVGSAAAETIGGESGRPSKNSSKATGTVQE